MTRYGAWIVFAGALLLAAASALAGTRPAPLDALATSFGGWAPLREVRTMTYRLTRFSGGTRVGEVLYRLDLESGHVWSRDMLTNEESWWDGATGWRRAAKGNPERDAGVADRLREHAAYHFFRLLRDPATRAEWINLTRIRIKPAGQEAFEVELDPSDGRIRSNHFGDVTVREGFYEPVGQLVWPMKFIVEQPLKPPASGHFSAVRLLAEPALPVPP
ncbi:MAG: hypothetical protein HZA32_21090 [Opitutae bacterium]|nr:hypothetical protein [Opitutae bacterium]